MFCIATFAAAFAGPASSCLRPAAYTLSTARTTCPLAFDDQPETLTQHVEHRTRAFRFQPLMLDAHSRRRSLRAWTVQVEAARLSAATGVAVPQQCVDDVCLEMSAYVELLESTVATLQAEGGLPKASTNPTGVYIEKLQAKIALLCADLDMAVPPQCVGDECLEDSAYVLTLSSHLLLFAALRCSPHHHTPRLPTLTTSHPPGTSSCCRRPPRPSRRGGA
jgi:hypothetical protein